jgi:mannosyltransferase
MASAASTVRARAVPRLNSLATSTLGVVAFVLSLVAVSLVLRTLALGDSLWMDEGLSIGLAKQPLFDIPGDLRQDGNPPLYYVLLHIWMSVFGDGPGATQGLSVAISLLAIPVGLWAGWTLFGRRAGLIAASLGALNPFLTTYAQETRMYSLMVVLSLALTGAFVHVYIYRDRRYLPVFGVVLALMLYTHSWGLFVTFGALVAFGIAYLEVDDKREMIRDGLLGFGIALLLFLPWLPTLWYQVGHTGAPWVNPPRFGVVVQISKSILGGGTVTVALVLAAGSGLAAVWARGRRGGGDPASRLERQSVLAVFALGAATLAIAWIASQVAPAWTTRYLGVSLGPLILLASLGLARAGNLGLAALAIVLAIWIIPHTNNLQNKSNAADLGAEAAQVLKPGDMVVVMQPEQTPLVNYELVRAGGPGPADLRWATQLGAVENPEVMDWRDGLERMEDATPDANLTPLLATLPRSARVLLVHPITTQRDQWDAPWTELVRRRSAQWGRAMEESACFTRAEDSVPRNYRRATRIGVRGVLYTKTGC